MAMSPPPRLSPPLSLAVGFSMAASFLLSSSLVRRWLDETRSVDEPLVLAGDYNVTPADGIRLDWTRHDYDAGEVDAYSLSYVRSF